MKIKASEIVAANITFSKPLLVWKLWPDPPQPAPKPVPFACMRITTIKLMLKMIWNMSLMASILARESELISED